MKTAVRALVGLAAIAVVAAAFYYGTRRRPCAPIEKGCIGRICIGMHIDECAALMRAGESERFKDFFVKADTVTIEPVLTEEFIDSLMMPHDTVARPESCRLWQMSLRSIFKCDYLEVHFTCDTVSAFDRVRDLLIENPQLNCTWYKEWWCSTPCGGDTEDGR